MKLKWTQHSQDVLLKRKISLEWIDRTIDDPDKTCPDEVDPELRHYLKIIPEYGNRVLRVVVNIIAKPRRLVTFYFDRNMKGKL
jgi:hypothetical protein